MCSSEFNCVKCADQLDSLEALRRHITVEHLRWIPFECMFCDVFKPTEMELREHVQAKHPDKPFRLILVSDPANQERLQQLIDQSTAGKTAATENELVTVRSTSSPVEVENEQKRPCFSADVNLSAVKQSSLNESSGLNGSATALQQTLTPQANVVSAIVPPPNVQIFLPTEKVKPELVDISHDDTIVKPLHNSTGRIGVSKRESGRQGHQAAKQRFSTDLAVFTPEHHSVDNSKAQKRKRNSKLDYSGTDTSRCRLCSLERGDWRGGSGPLEHVYTAHIGEDTIVCKLCGFGTRYHLGRIKEHFRKEHPSEDMDKGIEDKREALKPRAQEWIRRCFGEVEGSESEAMEPEIAKSSETRASEMAPVAENGGVYCSLCELHTPFGHKRDHVYTKHLQIKPISCKYCDFTAYRMDILKAHLKKYHSAKDAETGFHDRRADYDEDYKVMFSRCYGMSPGDKMRQADHTEADDSSKNTPKVPGDRANFCHLCQASFTERKQTHADRKHVQRAMLFCEHCDFSSTFSLTETKRHVAKKHPRETAPGFLDKRGEFLEERRQMMQECFGQR